MEDTNGICEAVETGDLHGCRTCREVSEGSFCVTCDAGRCDICGCLVKKGQSFTVDPATPGSCFCGDCAQEIGQPSVREIISRLGVL